MSWYQVSSPPDTTRQIWWYHRGDVIGNCGITTITDIYERNDPHKPISSEEGALLYKALATHLNYGATNYLFSDNILKHGAAYPEGPRTTMDDTKLSTGGFIAWLIQNRFGRVSSSSRMCNPNHQDSAATSIIQLWLWTPPSMQVLEERVIQDGLIKREWLRGKERIFRKPKEFISQIVSTKW